MYCVLGVPVDRDHHGWPGCADPPGCVGAKPLFISTPNLNYLMLSQRDPAFRRSLLESDICPADGIGVLLICKLLGIPITSRVAGSDLPAALQDYSDTCRQAASYRTSRRRPGVGERRVRAINARRHGALAVCAAIDPGVMTAEKMADPPSWSRSMPRGRISCSWRWGPRRGRRGSWQIGQKLTVPVVSHLGATLNFLAGTVRRAPVACTKLGLEWLWRIKEEPKSGAALPVRRHAPHLDLLSAGCCPSACGCVGPGQKRRHARSGVMAWIETRRILLCHNCRCAAVMGSSPQWSEAFRGAAQAGQDIRLEVQRLKSFRDGLCRAASHAGKGHASSGSVT